ncbi:MAG: glycine cleavage system protein H, partial [Carnobacterium jeotgali]
MRYSENGLWVLKEGDNYRIGLSEKGQDDLGEVMFVELPNT